MIHEHFAAATPTPTPLGIAPDPAYRPGQCNIGPAEIARRRRAGHVGAILTLVVFAILVVAHVPPLARLVVGLPAAGAATGYLQAMFRFCAGFAGAGVFNFGEVGQTERVADAEARRLDRRRASQILLGSLAVGLVVAIVAVVVPL